MRKVEKLRRYLLFFPLAMFVSAGILLFGLYNIIPVWLIILVIIVIPAVIVYFIPKEEEEIQATPATTSSPSALSKIKAMNLDPWLIVVPLFLILLIVGIIALGVYANKQEEIDSSVPRFTYNIESGYLVEGTDQVIDGLEGESGKEGAIILVKITKKVKPWQTLRFKVMSEKGGTFQTFFNPVNLTMPPIKKEEEKLLKNLSNYAFSYNTGEENSYGIIIIKIPANSSFKITNITVGT